MPVSAIPSDIDVTQIVQKIRAEVDQRLEQRNRRGKPDDLSSLESHPPERVTSNLRALDNELDVLNSQLRSGEPVAPSQTMRSRAGYILKERLYRFLWWQTDQIQSLIGISARRGREETRLIDNLAANLGQMERSGQQTHELSLHCSRRIHDYERRLQELESAQLKLQATEIERNVREQAANSNQGTGNRAAEATPQRKIEELEQRLEAQAAEQESLTARYAALKEALEQLVHRFSAQSANYEETKAQLEQTRNHLDGVGQRADADRAHTDQLTAKLAEVGQRAETDSAYREQLAAQLIELSQRVDGDRAHKDLLALRLSQFGLFTHQTRATLSIQERRLGLFIEEARKRLPNSFTQEQVVELIRNHSDHQYDSLYMHFEDVFRGSRQEIKARQSVYLPFLKDRGIGSETMPILDLGCGRGEWLELLKEQNLTSTGVDRNDAMVRQCRSSDLEVVQGDAISYLASLPDASKGAITSFHMIEHLPFEVTLHLVDEALRVLKPGGVLILETPNPQNILVGSHTFYLDPTHLKPLPSPMVRFFVEARGFTEAQVWDLQPYPDSVRLPDDAGGAASRLNDYFYGPQDYAVLGVRP